nr:immunoglobulin heavy chain junction region [Macaca mulatta]MOW32379.1 immunoglobulin heavy chain junction region [Macaca mulatta]MOW32463.1 immunoglobulin heavy chain junction region [Macaca mulatta]MOW32512.1 immunoglobulin heavy chain junction region [Macaca mulatta]MOW32722.1 immunoglobulin heavy chain junction region [Macaca mulatta]
CARLSSLYGLDSW